MKLTEREKCAHLLRRFGLGASEGEMGYFASNGLKDAIERLLNYESVEQVIALPIETMANDKGNVNLNQLSPWVGARLLTSRRPLLDKMTIFWHNHFATGADKVKAVPLMAQHYMTLETHATGNFRELLEAMSKDPAMLIWLDNTENVKGKPNENFAREVMELFTLGVGNYSEKDVQEAARAFTGWNFRRLRGKQAKDRYSAVFELKAAQHDSDPKTVLGKSGNLNGTDVLDILCAKPRTAEFITTKLWNWFVYADPKPATIAPFAKVFYDSGYDIKTLLRAIMESEEFYSERAFRQLIKNPLDFCIVSLRQLGVGELVAANMAAAGENKRQLAPAAGATTSMKSQGMWLLFPPDVAGWKPGGSWITSATMVERIAWASKIFGTSTRGNVGPRYPAYELFESDPTPQGIAKKICSIFDARMPGNKMDQLALAADKAMAGKLTRQNANKVAAEVTRLLFGTPEFQVA